MPHLFHKKIILDEIKLKELLAGKMVTVGHTFNHEITIQLEDSLIEKSRDLEKLVDVIHLEEKDKGAIIIVREKGIPTQKLMFVKEELQKRFPGKQFLIIVGENIDVIKI